MFSFLLQPSISQIYTNLSIPTLPKHINTSEYWLCHLPLQNSESIHSWPPCLCTLTTVPLLIFKSKQTRDWANKQTNKQVLASSLTIYSHQYLLQLLNLFHCLRFHPSMLLLFFTYNHIPHLFTLSLSTLMFFVSVLPRSSTLLSKNYQRFPSSTLSYTRESSSFICLHFLYRWQLLPVTQQCQTPLYQ